MKSRFKRVRTYLHFAVFAALFLYFSSLIADTVTYAYDRAGRLVQVDYSAGKTIFYEYDPAGNLLRKYAPCFNWNTYMGHLPQWHDPITMLDLVADVNCPQEKRD